MKGHVNKWWELYRKVLPHDAPAIQVQETKRAFYAGAWAFITAIQGELLTPEPEPTVTDEETLQSIYEELLAFAQSEETL